MSFIVEMLEEPDDPLTSAGASGKKFTAKVQFLAKQNSPEWPLQIANEIVAAHLGQALGLNVPIVVPHRSEKGEFALVAWHKKLPASAAALRDFVNANPRDVHGAIIFDLFIANNDRAFGPERRNLNVESGRLLLYDHGNACFYRNRQSANIQAGIARLTAVESDLQELDDMGHKGNLYFQLLRDWRFVDEWCARVGEIPDFLIEAAVGRIPEGSSRPTAAERDRLVEFLVARRGRLHDQIKACCGTMFPNLPKR